MARARRRLRQRSRDSDSDVVASDSSSDGDIEFIGVQNGSEVKQVEEKGEGDAGDSADDGSDGRKDTGAWACPCCTFVNEEPAATRCEVCESVRPGARPLKTRKLSQWLDRSARPAVRAADVKAKTRSRKSGEAIDSNSDDDDVFSTSQSSSTTRQPPARVRSTKGLWADVYSPTSPDELCVNKKKVDELRAWIAHNSATTHSATSSRQRLMFLCGPPGAGKSTAVRCIAHQLGLSISEWSDNASAGGLGYERMLNTEYRTQHVSSLDDFGEFVQQSVSYAALPMTTSRKNSTARRRRNGAVGATASHGNRKRRLPGGEKEAAVHPTPVPAEGESGHIILVENWPHTWTKDQADSEEKLQQIFRRIVDPATRHSGFPVICVYSDVRESKVATDQLVRKFSSGVVLSPFTRILNINAVTAAQLRKCLTRISTLEQTKISPANLERLVAASNGDIRHALNTLQLIHNGEDRKPTNRGLSATKAAKKVKENRNGVDATESAAIGRDAFLSEFHVLGKILHGKTLAKETDEKKTASSPIDYEEMIDASGMSVDKVLAFVHENSLSYYSAIDDVAEAMELMSLTENFVAKSYSGVGNSEIFKQVRDVAQSILIRSVAVTNRNPERVGFRPITAPRTYAAARRMVSRREDWLQQRSQIQDHDLMCRYVCHGDAFIFEVEPFVAEIEVATVKNNLARASISGQPALHSLAGALTHQDELDDDIESNDGEPW